jgi:hypothetical protein
MKFSYLLIMTLMASGAYASEDAVMCAGVKELVTLNHSPRGQAPMEMTCATFAEMNSKRIRLAPGSFVGLAQMPGYRMTVDSTSQLVKVCPNESSEANRCFFYPINAVISVVVSTTCRAGRVGDEMQSKDPNERIFELTHDDGSISYFRMKADDAAPLKGSSLGSARRLGDLVLPYYDGYDVPDLDQKMKAYNDDCREPRYGKAQGQTKVVINSKKVNLAKLSDDEIEAKCAERVKDFWATAKELNQGCAKRATARTLLETQKINLLKAPLENPAANSSAQKSGVVPNTVDRPDGKVVPASTLKGK